MNLNELETSLAQTKCDQSRMVNEFLRINLPPSV